MRGTLPVGTGPPVSLTKGSNDVDLLTCEYLEQMCRVHQEFLRV